MRASKKKNTVTINGRTYDTVTGQPLNGSLATSAHPRQSSAGGKRIAVNDHNSRDSHVIKVTRLVGSGHKARQPERSKTLMRNVVKRPSLAKQTHAVAGVVGQPKHVVINKGVSKDRSESILKHTKSDQISRFAPAANVTKKTAHLPVVKAPASHSHSYDISNVPPVAHHAGKQPLKEIHKDLFEAALQGATSHQAKKIKLPKQRHHIRIGAAAMSLVLLIAFYTYQNVPKLALSRASSTIGFNAQLPSYQPAGFRLNGGVHYQAGRVSMAFQSNSDNRNFTITQVAMDINDQTLASSFLSGKSYQKVNANGQTGFIYDRSNLTWAKNGVWYNLVNNAKLSQEQLFHIAASL